MFFENGERNFSLGLSIGCSPKVFHMQIRGTLYKLKLDGTKRAEDWSGRHKSERICRVVHFCLITVIPLCSTSIYTFIALFYVERVSTNINVFIYINSASTANDYSDLIHICVLHLQRAAIVCTR